MTARQHDDGQPLTGRVGRLAGELAARAVLAADLAPRVADRRPARARRPARRAPRRCPMPTWNACTDASSTAAATSAPVRPGSTRARISRRASSTAARPAGGSATRASGLSRDAENWAATTAPTAATASSPAMRAIALLTPEAIPALRLVRVGEHGRRERRDGGREAEREHEQRRQQVRDVVDVGVEPLHQDQAGGREQRAAAHEQPRPEPVREPPRALREQEHDDGRRQHREPRVQRATSPPPAGGRARGRRTSMPSPPYIAKVSRLPTAKLRRRKRPSGSIGCGGPRLVDEEGGEQQRRPRSAGPTPARCPIPPRAGG